MAKNQPVEESAEAEETERDYTVYLDKEPGPLYDHLLAWIIEKTGVTFPTKKEEAAFASGVKLTLALRTHHQASPENQQRLADAKAERDQAVAEKTQKAKQAAAEKAKSAEAEAEAPAETKKAAAPTKAGKKPAPAKASATEEAPATPAKKAGGPKKAGAGKAPF